MLIKELAKRIPDKVRSQRIVTISDPILYALPNQFNPHMMMLAEIWYEFIETNKERSYCPVCLSNILNNYRQMKQALIDLEKEYKILYAL